MNEFILLYIRFALSLPLIKQKKVNENNVRKYILVVAPVTTPTVVREQRSYVYM